MTEDQIVEALEAAFEAAHDEADRRSGTTRIRDRILGRKKWPKTVEDSLDMELDRLVAGGTGCAQLHWDPLFRVAWWRVVARRALR